MVRYQLSKLPMTNSIALHQQQQQQLQPQVAQIAVADECRTVVPPAISVAAPAGIACKPQPSCIDLAPTCLLGRRQAATDNRRTVNVIGATSRKQVSVAHGSFSLLFVSWCYARVRYFQTAKKYHYAFYRPTFSTAGFRRKLNMLQLKASQNERAAFQASSWHSC